MNEKVVDCEDVWTPIPPSTYAALAGATVLARRYPRTTPLLLALAAGCGLTRVFAHAHYLSDVVAGALGGSAIGWRAGRRP